MRKKTSLLLACWFFVAGSFAQLAVSAGASDDDPSKLELESGIYYTVKKGDTLWDISNRYFNTHWRWPQIWSENQGIMNPHRIFPGERLRLFHQIWDASLLPETLDQPDIPSHQPVNQSRYYVYSAIHRIGFVTTMPIPVSGRISLVKGDKNIQRTLMSQDESVYVIPTENTLLRIGDVYAVYRPPFPVKDTETNTLVGFQYYKTGLIKIVENHEGYAVATVEKAFRSIMVNDLILPHVPKSSKIELISGKSGMDGKIFRTEEGTAIFGDDSIAFIDRGAEDGIQVGQTYAICENYYPGYLLDSVDFGSFLVLHTEATTATVLILRSDRSIQPPIKFRSPTSSYAISLSK